MIHLFENDSINMKQYVKFKYIDISRNLMNDIEFSLDHQTDHNLPHKCINFPAKKRSVFILQQCSALVSAVFLERCNGKFKTCDGVLERYNGKFQENHV